jgi:hypothetical protein
MISLPAIARKRLLAGIVAAALPAGLQAQVVWTDWTSFTNGVPTGGTGAGALTFAGPTVVNVTYAGEVQFGQTGCGANYFAPASSYVGGIVTAAPVCDMVAIVGSSNTNTITFSTTVTNPVMAFVSLGGQTTYDFDRPFAILESGNGPFGGGDPSLFNDGFSGGAYHLRGVEGNGTVQFLGSFDSISWNVTGGEYWNGFTVGAQGVALSSVPEPATVALTATGLLALVGIARRRRR